MFCARDAGLRAHLRGNRPLNDEERLLKDVKAIVVSSASDEIKSNIIREMLLIFADNNPNAINKEFHQRVSEALIKPILKKG